MPTKSTLPAGPVSPAISNRARVLIRIRGATERWAARGACRKLAQQFPEEALRERRAHTNGFFPGRTSSPDDVARAKSVCVSCPVRPECLAHSLLHWEKVGIWGGETEQERRRTRRKLRAAGAHLDDHRALEWVLDHLYATTPEDEDSRVPTRTRTRARETRVSKRVRPTLVPAAASCEPEAASAECA